MELVKQKVWHVFYDNVEYVITEQGRILVENQYDSSKRASYHRFSGVGYTAQQKYLGWFLKTDDRLEYRKLVVGYMSFLEEFDRPPTAYDLKTGTVWLKPVPVGKRWALQECTMEEVFS